MQGNSGYGQRASSENSGYFNYPKIDWDNDNMRGKEKEDNHKNNFDQYIFGPLWEVAGLGSGKIIKARRSSVDVPNEETLKK